MASDHNIGTFQEGFQAHTRYLLGLQIDSSKPYAIRGSKQAFLLKLAIMLVQLQSPIEMA